MAASRSLYGRLAGLGLSGMLLLGTSVAHAIDTTPGERDIGVVPGKLVVDDMQPVTGTANVTFVAKDPAIVNGRAADVDGVRARLHVEYGDGATAGAFVIPPGTVSGWLRDDPTMTRYRNPNAPDGATETRSVIVRPGRLLKLTGMGLGDVPLNIVGAGAPTGSIYVSMELFEAGVTTRLCSQVQNCEYRVLEGGAGARLKCGGGVADPYCHAAYPVYVSGEDARYGGAGTIAFIGDSITVQASAALKEAMVAARWFTHARAKSGSMFRELQPAAARIGQSKPQVVVIHLGTNDSACWMANALTPSTPCRFPNFTRDDLISDARAMVASVSGACVIGTSTWFGGSIGNLWYEMVATGELAGVIPWREYLLSLSTEERDLLLADALGHLTPAGIVALTELTAQVIEASCGAAP